MSEKKPLDHYYDLDLPNPKQITREEFVHLFGWEPEELFEQPDKIMALKDAMFDWEAEPKTFTIVEPDGTETRGGPSVEPRPFDCPVCEHIGFDCGAH